MILHCFKCKKNLCNTDFYDENHNVILIRDKKTFDCCKGSTLIFFYGKRNLTMRYKFESDYSIFYDFFKDIINIEYYGLKVEFFQRVESSSDLFYNPAIIIDSIEMFKNKIILC